MEPEQRHAGQRIVVGVDGSEQSGLALRWAARLADGLGARIEAIMAWHFPAGSAWGFPEGWNPEHDARTSLAGTIDAVFGTDPPAGLRQLVYQGMPAKVLLDASAGARMLIVGSRGHGGFAGLLLGSVSSAVAEHAHCPVLVVHPDRSEDGDGKGERQ